MTTAVWFPTSNPEGQARAEIEAGQLSAVPTWSIQTLNAGPARSAPAYDDHVDVTVGSSYDWSDELRFDKRSGRLASFVLKTPEAGRTDPQVEASWLALPRTAGLPVLADRETGFHVDPLDHRSLATSGALVVVDAKLPVADAGSLRLAIGGDVDLLFHGGRYGGWILDNPLAHLAAPGEAAHRDAPVELADCLRAYIDLVVEPNIDRMIEEDPDVRAALVALEQKTRQLPGRAAAFLAQAVAGVLETFYS